MNKIKLKCLYIIFILMLVCVPNKIEGLEKTCPLATDDTTKCREWNEKGGDFQCLNTRILSCTDCSSEEECVIVFSTDTYPIKEGPSPNAPENCGVAARGDNYLYISSSMISHGVYKENNTKVDIVPGKYYNISTTSITVRCIANDSITDPPIGFEEIQLGEILSCAEILGANGQKLVKLGITALRILVPLILILLSVKDFIKAIPSQDPDMIKKAWSTFGLRGIISIIAVLLPTILKIISNLTNVFSDCGEIF